MRPSLQDYDWLGRGIYFWQAAPIRAWMWKRHFALKRDRAGADETVVLEYRLTVNLTHCLDLLDIRWHGLLGATGRGVSEGWRIAGVDEATIHQRLLRNARRRAPHPHFLDCAAVNQVCERLEHAHNIRIMLVRAAFQQLGTIYPYSAFHEGDHVQVAIRDPNAIVVKDLREVTGLKEIEQRYVATLKKGT